jgi:hypothetical protein
MNSDDEETLIKRIDAVLSDGPELNPGTSDSIAGLNTENEYGARCDGNAPCPLSSRIGQSGHGPDAPDQDDSFPWGDACRWTSDPVDPHDYDFDVADVEDGGTTCSGYDPDPDVLGMPTPVWVYGKGRDGRVLTWRRHDARIPPEFCSESDTSFQRCRGVWRGDPDLLAATSIAAAAYRHPDLVISVVAIMFEVLGRDGFVGDSTGSAWRPFDTGSTPRNAQGEWFERS